MKTLLLALLLAPVVAFAPEAPAPLDGAPASATVEAATYTLDPYHTTLGFRIRHMGIAFVEGEFDQFEGQVTFDPADLAATRANVTVQMASVDTDVEPRDNHLRSADFFEVETYPTMTFASTGAMPTADGHFKLVGDLTIKGVTRPVVFDAVVGGPIADGENQRVGFHATATIDRRDFGVTYGQTLPGGFPAIGHEVKLVLDVEATTGA